jgi:hypothetical protein
MKFFLGFSAADPVDVLVSDGAAFRSIDNLESLLAPAPELAVDSSEVPPALSAAAAEGTGILVDLGCALTNDFGAGFKPSSACSTWQSLQSMPSLQPRVDLTHLHGTHFPLS